MLGSRAREGVFLAQVSDTKAAKRTAQAEFVSGAVFLLLAISFLAGAFSRWQSTSPLRQLLFYLAATFFIGAAGFLSAFIVGYGRRRGTFVRRHRRRENRPLPPALDRIRTLVAGAWAPITAIDWIGDWLAILCAISTSLLGLYAIWKGWHASSAAASVGLDQLVCASLLLGAFLLLILERHYAGSRAEVLTEAAQLDRICRVMLFALLGLALRFGLNWLGLPFSGLVEHGVAIILAMVAIEFCLRSAVYVFAPLAPIEIRKCHTDSVIAGLIRPRLPDLGALNASVRRQFGIDLARSWALGYVRRASLPLVFGMAVLSWLLTGVTALGTNQRAVYEAFGQPQSVLGPGLHVHWPWPFGVLRRVDFGTVRSVPIEFVAPGTHVSSAEEMSAADIESPAPASDDRLWGSGHSDDEVTYLVAASDSGRQSFGVIDVDMAVIYRIGLSDAAAEDSIYNITSPDDMIQSIATQMLSRYLAQRTITEVLGQNRDSFVQKFQKDLQSRLAQLSTGIEIMGVVVEAVHPPARAATSYQGVQTAAIQSSIDVSTASAEAAREMKMAQVVANATSNDAKAAAEERIDQAKADFTLFDSDRKAYAAGGEAFLFERRLDRLVKGLYDKPIIIIDHRVPATAGPTLDLRGAATPKSSTDEGDD